MQLRRLVVVEANGFPMTLKFFDVVTPVVRHPIAQYLFKCSALFLLPVASVEV